MQSSYWNHPELNISMHTGIEMCNNALIARDCAISPMREEARLNQTDRLRLEESALRYAMVLRSAMSQYRRSRKIQVPEQNYTTYTITRGPANGPFADVHTAEHYDSTTSVIHEQYFPKRQWNIVDRAVFMGSLVTTTETERQRVLAAAKECSIDDSMRIVEFMEQIRWRVLQPSGTLLPCPRVKAIVQQLTSVLLGEPASWELEAEIDGAWPEEPLIRLIPSAVMQQVWSVTYRDDVDAVEKRFDIPWEHLPDARLGLVGRGTSPDTVERQLRNLVRVFTLLGPNQVRLLRYARSQLGTRFLESVMAAPERLSDSGGRYCIRRSKTPVARAFIQRILPFLDGSSGEPEEGSMQRIGTSTLDLYDEGLRNHPDTVGGIAFKIASLESMFLTDDETAEVSYKLRIRVAAALTMLTGTDGVQVLANVGTAYGIRSGFFHGHVKRKDRESATAELADTLGYYCRVLVSVFLQSGDMNRKLFLRDLDAGLVDPKARTALRSRLQQKNFLLPLTAAECSQPTASPLPLATPQSIT